MSINVGLKFIGRFYRRGSLCLSACGHWETCESLRCSIVGCTILFDQRDPAIRTLVNPPLLVFSEPIGRGRMKTKAQCDDDR
jgi:hypothetical protein